MKLSHLTLVLGASLLAGCPDDDTDVKDTDTEVTDTETDGDLRPMLGQVAAAMWQVMAVGTPEQQAAAKDAIGELRKTLYGILAEEPGGPSSDSGEDLR